MPTDVLQIKLETDGEGKVKASLAGVSRSVKDVGDKSARASKSLLDFKGVIAILGGVSAVKLARSFVGVNAEFERLNASLVTVTGSVGAADAAFSSIERFATETPYNLQEVVGAFTKLKAMGLDPSIDALRSYGNTASAMGKSLNDMVEAVADASVGEFERLKEFGIKARSEGDQVAFTFKGVETTVRKSSDDIQQYLLNLGNTDFAGGMERQAETLGGAFSNLEDVIGSLARTIGQEGGLNELIREMTQGLTKGLDVVNKYVKNAPLREMAEQMDDLLERRAALSHFIDGTADMGEKWSLFMSGVTNTDQAHAALARLEGDIRRLNAALLAEQGKRDPDSPDTGSNGSGNDALDIQAEREFMEAVRASEQAVLDENEAYQKWMATQREGAERTKDLIDPNRELIRDMEELNLQLELGLITFDEWAEATMRAQEQMDGLSRETKESKKEFSELETAIMGWGSTFSAQLNDALWEAEFTFDSILEAFAKMLTQMIIQKQIVEPFLSWSFGGADTTQAHGGVWSGGVQKFATGGVVSSPTLFPMANGGTGLMGEAGWEAIMPLTRTSGGDLGVKAVGGCNVTVQVIDQRSGGEPAQVSSERGPDGAQTIRALIRDEVNAGIAGGSFDRKLATHFGLRRMGA